VVFLAAIAMNLYTLDTLPDMISESILPNQYIADQLRFLISQFMIHTNRRFQDKIKTRLSANIENG